MKILKASAGSGKTYHLSKHYVELLLKDGAPDRHRHILAVTFTNKATAAMKTRCGSRWKRTTSAPCSTA